MIDILKIAGYQTSWISNQNVNGKYGNAPAAFAKKANYVYFNFIAGVSDGIDGYYDEQLLSNKVMPILNTDKNFVVYHLAGTHNTYNKRYPKPEYNVFKASDYTLDRPNIQKMADYDNAVLYNDYVVNKIINKYKDEESLIIYFPDHAEEVLDISEFSAHGDYNINKYRVEIPFIIYTSDIFNQRHPEKVAHIKRSTNRPYMTDDVIHTMLDLMDIKTTEYQPSRSLINPIFETHRLRILPGKIDYDSELKK